MFYLLHFKLIGFKYAKPYLRSICGFVVAQPSGLVTNGQKAGNGLLWPDGLLLNRKGKGRRMSRRERETSGEHERRRRGRRDRVGVGSELELSWLSGRVTDRLGEVLIGGR